MLTTHIFQHQTYKSKYKEDDWLAQSATIQCKARLNRKHMNPPTAATSTTIAISKNLPLQASLSADHQTTETSQLLKKEKTATKTRWTFTPESPLLKFVQESNVGSQVEKGMYLNPSGAFQQWHCYYNLVVNPEIIIQCVICILVIVSYDPQRKHDV